MMNIDASVSYEFKSDGRFDIPGRGLVFAVKNPHECTNFNHLMGRMVMIDGSLYEIRGVERYMHCSPWREGEGIGLLVRQYSSEPNDAFRRDMQIAYLEGQKSMLVAMWHEQIGDEAARAISAEAMEKSFYGRQYALTQNVGEIL